MTKLMMSVILKRILSIRPVFFGIVKKYARSHLTALVALTIVELSIISQNLLPSKYLIGWDNTMPEFDIWTNFSRSFSSVWQSYRGFGLYDGMAHGANIMHTIYIGILALALPQALVRPIMIHLIHLLGGIGMYVFARRILKRSTLAIVAAFIYMLNYGTIQQFYAPLELFLFHYVALPWVFWAAYRYIDYATKRNLFIYTVINLLVVSQAHVPTIFVTFAVALMGVGIYEWLMRRSIRRSLILLLLLGAVNLFWLAPYIVGIGQNAAVIRQARINLYSSEDVYYRNQEFGDLASILSFKGFMHKAEELDGISKQHVPLMGPWAAYQSSWIAIGVYTCLAILMILGIVRAILKRDKQLVPFIYTIALSVFFLANNTPILRQLNDLWRMHVPILGEAFRFPFTKFILIYAFGYSIMTAYALSWSNAYRIRITAATVVVLMIFIQALPAFQGYFFSPLLRRELPNEYLKLFAHMQQKSDNRRVLLLPMHTFWSWQYSSWGQFGSGFLWFGIPQPIVMRAFDPWSATNEQAFNEFRYAIRTRDTDLFVSLLTKYQIGYILHDTNVIATKSTDQIDSEKMDAFVSMLPGRKSIMDFGTLHLYDFEHDAPGETRILSAKPVSYPERWQYRDPSVTFDYFSRADSNVNSTMYPFASMYSERGMGDIPYTLDVKDDEYTITLKKSPMQPPGNTYEVSFDTSLDTLVPVFLERTLDGINVVSKPYVVKIDGSMYSLREFKLPIKFVVPVDTSTVFRLPNSDQTIRLGDIFYVHRGKDTLLVAETSPESQVSSFRLDLNPTRFLSRGIYSDVQRISVSIPLARDMYVERGNLLQQPTYHLESNGISDQKGTWFGNLPQDNGYIYSFRSVHVAGIAPEVFIDNPLLKRPEVIMKVAPGDTENIVFVPPNSTRLYGYAVNFLSKGYTSQHSQTDIYQKLFAPLPYRFLASLSVSDTSRNNEAVRLIAHDQAYDIHWLAYDLTGANWLQRLMPVLFADSLRLKEHVLVNNWANGWRLGERASSKLQATSNVQGSNEETRNKEIRNREIEVIFWPQYLQYLGFAVLLVTIGVLIMPRYRRVTR